MHQHFYKLMNQLSNPAKVASTLDWKRFSGSTLLSLNIHRNRIGIAVASHPSSGMNCVELDPLHFADDHITIDKNCLERFQKIITDYKVCGIVVSWPLQHETGRMGAACGRVLYALEEIIDKSGSAENNVLSAGRPLCLWDSGHIIPNHKSNPRLQVDSFGRCAQYGNTSTKQEYRASKEQYHEDELTVVQQVWNDFCKEHWPDLHAASKEKKSVATKPDTVSTYGTYNTEDRIQKGKEAKPHLHHTIKLSDSANKSKKSLVQMAR
jgi:hypothetical protein